MVGEEEKRQKRRINRLVEVYWLVLSVSLNLEEDVENFFKNKIKKEIQSSNSDAYFLFREPPVTSLVPVTCHNAWIWQSTDYSMSFVKCEMLFSSR
jgi:hypothetical protein